MQKPPDALPPCADVAMDRDTNATTHQEAEGIVAQPMPRALLLARLHDALPPPGVAFSTPLSRALLLATIEAIREGEP